MHGTLCSDTNCQPTTTARYYFLGVHSTCALVRRPPWQLATIAQLTYYCVGSMKELFLLVDRHAPWTHTPFSTFVSANAPRLYRSGAFPTFPAVDSAVLFVYLTVLSFKRKFPENLSHCQTSLAKPGHIADVDLINKRRQWAWLHRTPLHRLLVGAHKS
jgi:hypothetical protein